MKQLIWYITRDQGHLDRSTTILDAWGSNLTNIIGTDTSLLVGLEGDMFVNAAEIMRWEGKWVEKGAKPGGGSGFSNQLYWLFARQSIIIGQANYGMVSIKALLSFAVFLDDVSMVCLSHFGTARVIELMNGSIIMLLMLTRTIFVLVSTATTIRLLVKVLKLVEIKVTPSPVSDGLRKQQELFSLKVLTFTV